MPRNAWILGLSLALAGCGHERAPSAEAPVAAGADANVVPAAPAAPVPPAAPTRWPVDAPLQAGMRRIRTASEALEHAEHGHLDAAQVRALGSEIESATQRIFAECKLEPAADAALHPLLARVLAASRALQAKPGDLAPIGDLREVLRLYPLRFNDPEWLETSSP